MIVRASTIGRLSLVLQAQIPAFRRSHREMFRGQRATCFWISESERTTREPQKGCSHGWAGSSLLSQLSPCRPLRTELIRCCTQRTPPSCFGRTDCVHVAAFVWPCQMLNAFRCFFLATFIGVQCIRKGENHISTGCNQWVCPCLPTHLLGCSLACLLVAHLLTRLHLTTLVGHVRKLTV